MYILDPHRMLVPVGIPGEIYVGGTGVARGYLNRVELTNQRFFQNPFIPGGSLYKSGDLGRWLPEGAIHYLGRNDDQVKIRGYRIELGEIEIRLLNHPHVKEAVVIARKDQRGDHYLSAYIVMGKEARISELREYLSNELPGYMVPAYFMKLNQLPLTSNRKIDKKGPARTRRARV